MKLRVARKGLVDARRMLVGFGIGLVVYAAFLASFFPTVRAQSENFRHLLDSYPPALKAAFGADQIFTGPGFLRGELFSAMLPILFLIYAIGRGSDAIAGEEERGQLEVPLSTPVTRRRLVLEKALAVGAGLALLSLLLFVVLAIANPIVGMDVSVGGLAAQIASLFLLATTCGALGLALGALRGRRGFAVALASTVAVASYVLDLVAKIVDKADGLKWISLFHYYGDHDSLTQGADWGGIGLLATLTAILVILAVWAFDRRDVGT